MDGRSLERIYLLNGLKGKLIEEIKKLAEHSRVPINFVPLPKLNAFNVPDHEGCIAQLSKIRYMELQDVISFVQENGETPLFIILDGITDIRNIGGIARTAYCSGVHALIIPDKGVGSLNDDAILTSAGALEKLSVCRVKSLMQAVDELHLNGIRVFASQTQTNKHIDQCNFAEPAAIIMGSEEKGIFPALLKVADEKFKIPMQREFDSFNVSVATGMILYEVMRQRNR